MRIKKENIFCIITALLALIVSLSNPYGSIISVFENFWYMIIMLIFIVNIKTGRFIYSKFSNENLKDLARVHLSLFYSKGVKAFIIGVMVFFKLLFGGIIIYMTLNKVNQPLVIFKDVFFINNSALICCISIVLEILLVALLTRKVIKINEGDDLLCQ